MSVHAEEFLDMAMQDNYYEQVVCRDVVKTALDPSKKTELKKFLFG